MMGDGWMHRGQRYPPDEGMRPEDQERGRDRKKKKKVGEWARQQGLCL